MPLYRAVSLNPTEFYFWSENKLEPSETRDVANRIFNVEEDSILERFPAWSVVEVTSLASVPAVREDEVPFYHPDLIDCIFSGTLQELTISELLRNIE